MFNKRIMAVFSILFLMLLSLSAVSADENTTDNSTVHIDKTPIKVNGSTFSDIQKSVDLADEGDVIELNGTYKAPSSQITIKKSLTVNGNGAVLDASNEKNIFKITSDTLTLKDLTLINSNAGVIIADGCNLTIINCTISDNGGKLSYDKHEELYYSKYDYGAITAKNGKLTVVNSTFSNNFGNEVSSIGASGCEVELINTTFKNHFSYLGRMETNSYTVYNYNSFTRIINCSFTDNKMGAVYIDNGKIVNCNFTNNYDGISNGEKVDVYNSTFEKNSYYSINGGSYNIYNSTFAFNKESAIKTYTGKINIYDSQFIKNTASNGGAINVEGGKICVYNSRFINNSAKYGGTIYSESYWNVKEQYTNSLTLLNSQITDSSASIKGGAIYGICADFNIENTTITTQASSKDPQAYIEVGNFNSNNSTDISITKKNKIEGKVTYISTLTSYYDVPKTFYIGVSYADDKYTELHVTKIIVKVYTGKKYKTYYFNPKYASDDPYFKITDKLSVGKHKVEIISNGKYYSFKKVTKYLTVKKAKTTVKAPKVTNKYKKSKYFKVTVKNKSTGKVVNGIKVKVKVYTGKKYKTYTIKTDKKGVAKLNTKSLKIGKHKVVISSGNSNYQISKNTQIVIKR